MTEEFYETSFLLPNSKNIIPYFKHLRLITGSVTASILMQQLEYWFSKSYGPFYKFLSPLKEGNGYKPGDSWTEELGFSESEFRSAFSKIGIAYKSKGQFDQAKDKFQGRMYCSYYDRIARKTWYFRSKQVEANLGKLRKLISRNEQSSFAEVKNVNFHIHYTENTSKNTPKKPPIAPQGAPAKKRVKSTSPEIQVPEVLPPLTHSLTIPVDQKKKTKDSPLNQEAFNLFWIAYPKKRNKGQAEKAFRKLNPDKELLDHMLDKLETFKQSKDWRRLKGKYIPYPATWLNAQGWEDEIDAEVDPLDPLEELEPQTVSDAKWLDGQRQARFLLEEDQDKIRRLYNEDN